MKKRLSEFTLKEIKKVCKSFDGKGCKDCPFYNVICDDLSLFYATSTNLNKGVEIK